MTHSRPAVRELLTSHGLAPRRDLGQNFVADPNTVRRIAHLAGVGPGDRRRRDRRRPRLADARPRRDRRRRSRRSRSTAAWSPCCATSWPASTGVTVVEADAMALDWPALLGDGRPAGCSSPTCRTTWRRRSCCDLLDTRAGDRADARDGAARGRRAPRRRAPHDGYGAVSVKVAYWATARLAGLVPAAVFMPKPERRVGARRDRPPPAARRGAGAAVRAGAHGLRAAPQDAPPLAGRARRRADVRGRRRRRDGPARGARRSTTGSG